MGRPLDGNPSELDLRQRDRLRQPSEPEGQCRPSRAGAGIPDRPSLPIEGVVGKHLVEDQRGFPRRAPPVYVVQLARGEDRAGGVVRTDGKQRPCFLCPLTVHALKVHVPPPVVVERVAPRPDPVERRQMLEERVARRRDEHGLRAGIAEELEQQRVRLAGARGHCDVLRRNLHAAARVVGGNGLSRRRKTKGLRIIYGGPGG